MAATCPCGGVMYHGRCANPKLHAAWVRAEKARPKLQEAGRKGGAKGGPKAEEAGNLKKSPRRQGKKKKKPGEEDDNGGQSSSFKW